MTVCSRCNVEPAVAVGCATWDGPVCEGCSWLPAGDEFTGTDPTPCIVAEIRQIVAQLEAAA